ncbi:methanogenesis imperfect marker protein 11 [Methanocalculus alkaliphilus]|uniref:methanogenesis marker protein 11 n=1 Tax=Methanocalculus alkaliphilus TaxID=768730 RepID=UPI00209D23F4|nr:methanogenesis marker protein 11 [Methanocalculus alkaliphilus]MCP1715706.1 methanogenesis imperfect marker protein 11 [Methanocalculus alkaliphilus]
MQSINDPYSIIYPEILGIASEDGTSVELIERFDCIGGAMWVRHHYAKSPLVRHVRTLGLTNRYFLTPGAVDLDLVGSRFPAGIARVSASDSEIGITYIGMGGGGVGASICRAGATGVIRSESDPCGGGKIAGSRIVLPRRQRLIIGVDDTDTPDAGATWTLCHNIAEAVCDDATRYLSHTITQLYPVAYRTKNCVAVACEFATADPAGCIDRFENLLMEHTLSDETGMAAYTGFDPSPLLEYGWKVKRGEITRSEMDDLLPLLDVRAAGRGLIGAVAAIPFATRFDEALLLCDGTN